MLAFRMQTHAIVLEINFYNFYVCRTDFIITASHDGHVKFWKKIEEGIEFVKHFRSHLGKDFPLFLFCFGVFYGFLKKLY